MWEKIKEKLNSFKLKNIETIDQLKILQNEINVDFSNFYNQIKHYADEEKKKFGQTMNDLKNELHQIISEKKENIEIQNKINNEKKEFFELVERDNIGFLHPLTVIENRVKNILFSMGFEFFDAPEIDTVFHNFTALNIPEKHPSRTEHQSFYLENDKMLRTQTSNIQNRFLKSGKKQIFTIGKTFRNDSDSTHLPAFHQIEIMKIGANLNDLIEFLQIFFNTFFQQVIKIRLRSSHFPFVRFAHEVDILWKDRWLEVLGCGITHEKVFEFAERPFELCFAAGLGLERLTLLYYSHINDLRSLCSNDIRFAYKNGLKSYT